MIYWSSVDPNAEGDYDIIGRVAENLKKIEPTDFSENNRRMLKEYFLSMPACNCILEIGVENNPDKNLTSTATFLKNKSDNTFYFGIDLHDRSHLNDPSKNIYTIRHRSEDVEGVMNIVRSVYRGSIDFLFIDGWHSINQCKVEFDWYTPYLSKRGIVGFHDTNHHFGPKWLVECGIDRSTWNVTNYPGDSERDFGIGFAKRISDA